MNYNKPQMIRINADLMVLFDLEWCEQQTAQVWPEKVAALDNFLTIGRKKGFDPHSLFSTSLIRN